MEFRSIKILSILFKRYRVLSFLVLSWLEFCDEISWEWSLLSLDNSLLIVKPSSCRRILRNIQNTPIHQQAFADLASKFASTEHDGLILNLTDYLLIAFVIMDELFLDSARIYGNEGESRIPSWFPKYFTIRNKDPFRQCWTIELPNLENNRRNPKIYDLFYMVLLSKFRCNQAYDEAFNPDLK